MSENIYSSRLEDQAAATALKSKKETRRPSVLDEDGKLSSASAAMSLKYAQAQDLPSFPSAGLKLSSAGAAASLADSNKRSFEHWKSGPIPAANKAAMLAKDYEMDPLWQPEMSAAGSKAALLAHKDTTSPEIWKSQGTEAGHSAAGRALKTKSPNAITERDVPADDRRKALLAATGAMAGNRPRAGSTPTNKGDSSSGWALKAANSSQKGVPNSGPFTTGDPGFEAARIQNQAKSNVNRQLYGSNPPVAIEVEEKNRQDMLRASAVAMAKKMYAIQQTHIDEASGVRRSDSKAAANSSHRRNLSEGSAAGDVSTASQPPRYENLEEAARKLAQERLSKMRDEHAEYRQYYGASTTQPQSRLSMRTRRRGSTGSAHDSSDDEEQPRRIRKQMSIFQNQVAEVDTKRRQADRDALLAAAQRNVQARMSQMDERIFQETGKASTAQKVAWEKEAREKAQISVDQQMENTGKVHIGGGKYLDQSEIDAIARARLQPTLDEMDQNAEKQRARDTEIRLEAERVQEQAAKEKAREAAAKAEMKATQDAEKAEARQKKAEEKQAAKEQATAEKERLRKEKEEAKAEKAKRGVEKQKQEAEAAAAKERARQEREEKVRITEAAAAEEKEKVRLEKKQKEAEEAARVERARQQREEKIKITEAAATEDKSNSADAKPKKFNSLLKRRGKENTDAETDTEPATGTESNTASKPPVVVATGDTYHDSVTVPQPDSDEDETTGNWRIGSTPASQPTADSTADSTAEPTTRSTTHSTAVSTAVPKAAPASETPVSPVKRDSKVVSWFKTLTGSGKATKEESAESSKNVNNEEVDRTRDGSVRDVAMAGRETDDMYGSKSREDRPISPIRDNEGTKTSRSSSISSYSEHDDSIAETRPLSGTEHTAQVGRSGLKPKLLKKNDNAESGDAPRGSYVTSNTTDEDKEDHFEEARDKFEDDKLVLPPAKGTVPASPRASHEQSKFKEEL